MRFFIELEEPSLVLSREQRSVFLDGSSVTSAWPICLLGQMGHPAGSFMLSHNAWRCLLLNDIGAACLISAGRILPKLISATARFIVNVSLCFETPTLCPIGDKPSRR